MAVERIFRCNFCREQFKPEDSRLVGIHWTGSGGGSEFHACDAVHTENHLCVRCIKCIVTIANTSLKGRI